MTARDALRVRRYLDGELVDERELTAANWDVLGVDDSTWAAEQTAAGRRWRVVIDDPAGDIPTTVVLHGGPQA